MESEGDEESLSESHKQLQQLTDSVPSKICGNLKTSIPLHRPARQLWLHAALMCGRDFLYAIEVVLVTPIMLQLGMPDYLYSYIWFISPTFGLLLGPLMGNWSDKCTLQWGRRRPFILSFVIGTVVGLTLMILSKDLASALSNIPNQQRIIGIVFGVAGTQLMDFCLDQLEAPLRAYTLDVCSPSDQQRAFTLQSIAMGTGAALGFIIDGIKWNEIFGVETQGIQVKVVYAFAMIIYFIVTVMTLTSIKETPWRKPKKKVKIVKDISLKKQNSTTHHIKARRTSSEPAIPKHRDLINSDNYNSRYIQNQQVPPVMVPSESDVTNVIFNSNVTSTPEPHKSAAVRSITVLPRISLCKSVFMTMSCPEGLNETDTSESNVTSTSFDMENDESSSDESAKKTDSQDNGVFGQSLPNLSENTPQQLKHPKIFELAKRTFASSTGGVNGNQTDAEPTRHTTSPHFHVNPEEYITTVKGTTDSVDVPQLSIKTSNDNLEIQRSCVTDNTTRENSLLGSEDFLHCAQDDDSSKKQLKIGDINSNGVVRKIEFEEKPLLQQNSRSVKLKRRKEKNIKENEADEGESKPVSTRLLWLSILTMPAKFRFLCFSLLISFMGIEIELLWYTNIFGSVVYGGDPAAPQNSTELQLYNDGVHMGCWGLTLYATTVMVFSIAMEHFDILTRVSTRFLYAGGQLVTAVSTMVMFLFPTQIVMLLLSWTFGITVSTSLIIPYLLVGKYHRDKAFVMKSPGATKRGYGTDCAILACQMYAGNLMYAAVSGPVIYSYGGVKIMLAVASICHMVAFVICTWFVTYPGERSYKFCNRKPRTNTENAEM